MKLPVVIKRDGRKQEFDSAKIIDVAKKAGATDVAADWVAKYVLQWALHLSEVHIEHIQDLVERGLMRHEDENSLEAAKRFILYRDKRNQERQNRMEPDARLLSGYIQASKYAKFQDSLGRREVWVETARRNMEMHIRRFPELEDEIVRVFENFVFNLKVLGSMRGMQFGGVAVEKNHARMYNCCFSHADRPRFFSELFFLLLSGSGVGYSVQRQHVAKLPKLAKIDLANVWWHAPEDSIEGWASCLDALVKSYMDPEVPWYGHYLDFDFQGIRQRGVPLKTSGGKAPGHVPLKLAMEQVRNVLSEAQGRQLRPIEVHDICCLTADAVLAGGIRRSAMISLFSPSDTEMLEAKTGNWYERWPYRGRANNSAVLVRGDVERDKDAFDNVFQYMKEYGEPGFFFTPHADYGCNPCGEIGLNPVDADTGETGFSFCNLTEINGAAVESPEHFVECAKAAAFLGTLQAAYTDFPYLSAASKRIADREALLGVSITGIMDNPIVLDQANQVAASMASVAENRRVAKLIGIRPAARITTVKPSGTASLLLGCSSGIHPHHARRYIRRVVANPLEPAFQFFKSINPHMCVETKTGGDWVIEFPIKVRSDAVLRDHLTAVEFMDRVFSTYEFWIKPGTADPMSSPGLTHNVSCTVSVKPDEWEAVKEAAWRNRLRIAAMSFLPWTGDKAYALAPREAVINAADEAHWNELIAKYKPVDWTQFQEAKDETNVQETAACEGPMCEIKR